MIKEKKIVATEIQTIKCFRTKKSVFCKNIFLMYCLVFFFMFVLAVTLLY